ncbi:toll-like receptor 13 [Sitodiplosis mosellana]|uniref:toll-like receptor 13 n=1 Tax=Sitodiplosis mosellana TaxID=263140 RepID=UPI002444F51F|nr:toll-like receptor 13 [Sitodiplosis mosellana]
MKHVTVSVLLVLLVDAQFSDNYFPVECYSQANDTLYLQFICTTDRRDHCLKLHQYDVSNVKSIKYLCKTEKLKLFMDVLKPFTDAVVLDISNLGINSVMFDSATSNYVIKDQLFSQFKLSAKQFKASYNNLSTIEVQILSKMPQIADIDYSHNQILYLNFHQLDNPSHALKVNCSNNKIKSINKGDFSKLQMLKTLDLSFNDIEWINADGFLNISELTVLNLQNNPITQIDSKDYLTYFSSLYNLQTLDLSNSHIQTINDHTFANNHKLINLNLGNSLLKNLKATFISSLNMLEKIDISNTKIEEIDDDCFINNPNMKMLNLEGTSMNKFNFNTFSSKAKLVEVHLPNRILELDISCAKSICHFKQFDEKDYFENIQAFNVSGNRKQNISKLLKKIGPNVETLDLSQTDIRTLNVGMLEAFPKLLHLNLSHSNISKIEDGAFIKQSQLIQTLNLVGNKLSKLGMVSSNNLPKLKSLKISKNLFDSSYLYNNLNEWKKNGLEIDVELVHRATTQRTTAKAISTSKTTTKTGPKTTTTVKTTTMEATTPKISTSASKQSSTTTESAQSDIKTINETTTVNSTSIANQVTTTQNYESSSKNTNSEVYIYIGGVFIIIIIIIILLVIWYICRKKSTVYEDPMQPMKTLPTAYAVGRLYSSDIGTNVTTLPAQRIGCTEEINEPTRPMRTLPTAYAVGILHQMPNYENLPAHTTTLDRYYQFENNYNASLQSNEYATVYHHYGF